MLRKLCTKGVKDWCENVSLLIVQTNLWLSVYQPEGLNFVSISIHRCRVERTLVRWEWINFEIILAIWVESLASVWMEARVRNAWYWLPLRFSCLMIASVFRKDYLALLYI